MLFFFPLVSSETCHLFPQVAGAWYWRWQPLLAMVLVLQCHVAEPEMRRAQIENAFVPSSYEAKGLYELTATACVVTVLAWEAERKVAQP